LKPQDLESPVEPCAREGEITRLLRGARQGDAGAVDQLFVLLYRDLYRLARAKVRKHRTLQNLNTTMVLHESYIRLNHVGALNVEDRSHFFTYAARVMRSVIVDLVRSANAERRGGGELHVTLNTEVANAVGEEHILDVHRALEQLESIEPRLVRVVEARFFAGLTEVETASLLSISDRTVRRDWEKAKLMIATIIRES
jgi:RNA polymerase sigma factor (TIGR02999 family)